MTPPKRPVASNICRPSALVTYQRPIASTVMPSPALSTLPVGVRKVMEGAPASSVPSAFTRKLHTLLPRYSETPNVPPSGESAMPFGAFSLVAAVKTFPPFTFRPTTCPLPVSVK